MNICIINTLYPPHQVGGAEKSVKLLAEALSRAGDTVSVVTLHPSKDERVEVVDGVRVYRVPLDNSYWPYVQADKPSAPRRVMWHMREMWNRAAARRIARILDVEQPDVVHANVLTGFSTAVLAEARRRGIRTVQTLRDYSFLCSRSALFRAGQDCVSRCTPCVVMTAPKKASSQTVDAVASNSRYVIEAHQRHGYFKGVQSAVVYNIADVPAQAAGRPGFDEAPDLVFGFIGRIEDEKGIDVVLEAFAHVRRPGWRLLVAGRGLEAYVDGLKRTYADPRIEWLGFAAADDFYRAIDVSLISSVWPEPLPRTLIESYAYGRSAICARAGGIPEISHLGAMVRTYAPRDVNGLALLIEEALGDREAWRAGGLSRSDALEVFSEDAVTRRYQALYRSEPIEPYPVTESVS